MEILFLILAFLLGLVVGGLAVYFAIRYLQNRLAKKMVAAMTVPGLQGTDDPMSLVLEMFSQTLGAGAKKIDG